MTAKTDTAAISDAHAASERLNRECFCITLDRDALCGVLNREAEDAEFCALLIKTRPQLFSNAPMFISETEVAEMLRTVRAIETAGRLAGYREAALSRAPAIAQRDFGPLGAFMGYDFHLAVDGPKLIEINTNAGGAFLNAALARAQRACCAEVEAGLDRFTKEAFDSAVLAMFRNEWTLQRKSGMPRRIAIVDDVPEAQYLYPEFVLAQRLFMKHGIDAVVADAGQLGYEGGRLRAGGEPVDLVYNRVVDFVLERPEHAALRQSYLDGAVVVTPNPHVHALLADKRNMALLSDPAALLSWGLAPELAADLARIPPTTLVTAENAQHLWETRKRLFFKPAGGYGSKAVYRGDKLTRGVWAEIAKGGYVAQAFVPPSERTIRRDGSPEVCKVDVRLYVYDGQVLLTAARLYQGQTTNFRTPGGGFAPVFVA
jgi:hypothetical protein